MDLKRFEHGGGGAAHMTLIKEEAGSDDQEGAVDQAPDDEYEASPIMGLVHRTLVGMGTKTDQKQGTSMLQKQVEMLRVYCLQCLNNDDKLFQKASKALDSTMDEDELEEMLIRILGHEKYGMCGVELLYYKNFTFNLRQK